MVSSRFSTSKEGQKWEGRGILPGDKEASRDVQKSLMRGVEARSAGSTPYGNVEPKGRQIGGGEAADRSPKLPHEPLYEVL